MNLVLDDEVKEALDNLPAGRGPGKGFAALNSSNCAVTL